MHLPEWTAQVHHDGSEAYLSNPLPRIGETVTVNIRAPRGVGIDGIYIRAMLDGEFRFITLNRHEFRGASEIWQGELPVHQPRIDYLFKILTFSGAYYYTAAGISRADVPDYYSFTLLANYDPPLWVRDTVFYQIFPDRFENGDPSNDVQDDEYQLHGRTTVRRTWGDLPTPWKKSGSMDFFGGDLQGITKRLDYLEQLGVNAIYLTPIFDSETNHRYDIRDFFHVERHVGGDAALAELRAETTKRGMKLMLDITTNHVSFRHPWLLALEKDHQGETAEYFFYDAEKQAFELWLGVPLLVKLNYSSQRLRDVMYRGADAAMKKWLRPPYSIDAWRLDVANMTGNRADMQLDHDVWEEMRGSLKAEKPDVYLLGEYFQDGTPHLQGDELDASMNYQGFNIPLRRWIGGEDIHSADGHPYADPTPYPTEALAQQWMNFLAPIPYAVALQQFNQLDSHDTTRILHVASGDKQMVRLAATLLMGFPGVPCIYYGTEIALDGAKDPDNRRTMPWDESEWDQQMLADFRKLIAVRNQSHALKHGGFKILHASGDAVAFLRESLQEKVIVVGYRGQKILLGLEVQASMCGLVDGDQLMDLISGATFTVAEGQVKFPPFRRGNAMILKVMQTV